MDAMKEILNLTGILLEMKGHYQNLLSLLETEKGLLINVESEKIALSNAAKEHILKVLTDLEHDRLQAANAVSVQLNMSVSAPRLLEIVLVLEKNENHKEGLELKILHTELIALMQKIDSLNQENALFVASGLRTIQGAIDNIKEHVSGSKVYERKGQYKAGQQHSGFFVKKEA